MEPLNVREAQRLRGLPIDTKAQALEFVAAYRAWIEAISTYGNGMALANSRPAGLTYGDIFKKAKQAYIVAEVCYWQRPFDHPANRSAGIPRATWERARQSRGLAV